MKMRKSLVISRELSLQHPSRLKSTSSNAQPEGMDHGRESGDKGDNSGNSRRRQDKCLLPANGHGPTRGENKQECAKRPVWVFQISSGEGEEWKKADLKQMLAEAVPILCKRLRRQVQQDNVNEATDQGQMERKAAEEKPEIPQTKEPKPQKTPLEKVIEGIVVELDNLVAENKWEQVGNTGQFSLENKAIYFTDSGGQQAFWDLAPIFMHSSSIILFVHRLCDKLGEKPLNDW